MESKDREVRLLNKIDDLGRQLDAARDQSDRLSTVIDDLQRRDHEAQESRTSQKSSPQADRAVTQRSKSGKRRWEEVGLVACQASRVRFWRESSA